MRCHNLLGPAPSAMISIINNIHLASLAIVHHPSVPEPQLLMDPFLACLAARQAQPYLPCQLRLNGQEPRGMQGLGWWSWNANSGDTGGLVDPVNWSHILWPKVYWLVHAVGLKPWFLAPPLVRAFAGLPIVSPAGQLRMLRNVCVAV